MNFRCDGFALSEAVLKVIKATPIKKNNSILEGIKITAEEDYVTLVATDNELTIIKKIAADVKIAGKVLVKANIFSEYVRSIGQKELEVECTDGKTITVKYGDNKVEMKCMEVDEYPDIDEVNTEVVLEITKDDLRDVINKTAFSASIDAGKPALRGCLFDIKDKYLTVVSLDGYRLSMCNKKLLSSSVDQIKYIIPARSLKEIQKFVEETDENVKMEFNEDKLYVNINNSIIITRLIKGKYPNYEIMVPSDIQTEAVVNKEEFTESIRRVTIVTKEGKNNLVKLDFKDNNVHIETNGDSGEANENVVAKIEGVDVIICFNSRYLLDCLSVIDDEFIKINIKANNSPCIINQVAGDEYLFLVLPMRVNY